MTCKAAKEAFVAKIKVGVGPGVNMELNMLVRKVAIQDTGGERAARGRRYRQM